MSVNSPKKAAWLVALVAFALAAAGCGSNPPCQTDIATVDAARSAATASEADLEEAQRRQAELARQADEELARQQELVRRKVELQAQIDELGG